jgi:hypothetical protein
VNVVSIFRPTASVVHEANGRYRLMPLGRRRDPMNWFSAAGTAPRYFTTASINGVTPPVPRIPYIAAANRSSIKHRIALNAETLQ